MLSLFQFAFSGFNNQLGSPVFTIDDGAQAPIVLAAKDRSVIAATFTKFLLRNIGKQFCRTVYVSTCFISWIYLQPYSVLCSLVVKV